MGFIIGIRRLFKSSVYTVTLPVLDVTQSVFDVLTLQPLDDLHTGVFRVARVRVCVGE